MAQFVGSSSGDASDGPKIDTWGTKGYLLAEQHEALIEFLETVEMEHMEFAKFNAETLENAALRFLRARQFSVPDALALLAKCAERKAAGRAQHFAKVSADECVQCDSEALRKFYPHCMLGYDKFNRPILFEQSGRINPAAITAMTSYASLVDYHWHTMEQQLNEMFDAAARDRSRGGAVISTCAVLDLEGMGLAHCTGAALDHMKALVALDNVCYPETLGKMIVINAPWLAVTTWEVVRGWLDPRTQAKIEILGAGPETTAKLLQYIDAANLPIRYGGTAPDPECLRPSAELVQVPRMGDVRRSVVVPGGHTLYVDSYVPEGEVSLEIYVSPVQFVDGSQPLQGECSSSKSNKSTESDANSIPGGCKLEDMVQLSKESLLRAEGQNNPARNTQAFPNPTEQGMLFTARWSNSAMLVSRSAVINMYTEPDPSLAH